MSSLFIRADKSKISDSYYLILSDLIDGVEFGDNSVSVDNRARLIDIKNELLNRFNNTLPNMSTQGDQSIILPSQPISQEPLLQQQQQQQQPPLNRLIVNDTQLTVDNSANV